MSSNAYDMTTYSKSVRLLANDDDNAYLLDDKKYIWNI